MKTINDLIELSRNYDTALDRRDERIRLWSETQFLTTLAALERIKVELTERVTFYKSNLYVDGNVREWQKGITLRCGSQNIHGKPEIGFSVLFTAVDNGKILVLAFKHFSGESSGDGIQIGLYDPEEMVYDKIVDIVYEGITKVQKSSRLFIGDN